MKAIETDNWAEERAYRQRDPKEALQKFYESRMTSLEILEGLFAEGNPDLPIRHPVYGQTTLAGMISHISQHDRSHLRQSWEIINI